jgi:hypothetical protein
MGQTTVRRGFNAMLLAMVCASFTGSAFAEKFELGVETKQQLENQQAGYPAYPAYPAPAMVPQQPKQAPVVRQPIKTGVQQNQRPPMQTGVQQNQRPPMQMQAQVEKPGVLPPAFLGAWQVAGLRSNVEAQPAFQQGIGGIFQVQNAQIWNIQGNPGSGYVLQSDTGVQTQLYIDKVAGNTAFIRYQHPIKNTMAQEAIVMQLSADGRGFSGLERISIVKQGEPQPRAKVTYQLTGRRR